MELQQARINNNKPLEQTTLSVSNTVEQTSTPSPGNIKEFSTPTLSDLQEDVIDNLELIAELVKQVLVLDERAANIFEKHKPDQED